MVSLLVFTLFYLSVTAYLNETIPVCDFFLITFIFSFSLLSRLTVPMQYWTSSMFTREVAGTANSLAAGWGNLGGGITQILIGSILFPLFKLIYGETDPNEPAEKAWRTACVVPGFFCLLCAWGIIRYVESLRSFRGVVMIHHFVTPA